MSQPSSLMNVTRSACAAAFLALLAAAQPAAADRRSAPASVIASTPMQVFGVWHCGSRFCEWSETVDMVAFDRDNRWLLARDASGKPAVNLVVLSFVDPLKMLRFQDLGLAQMIPPGMTKQVVAYFKDHGIRVMLSIGGSTYVDEWDAALAENPEQLARNAAYIAKMLGVGIEIDYENATAPNLAALGRFIATYRNELPYDASGANHAARLTIDVAAGDRWLIDLNRHATRYWLDPAGPVLDYANAMVGRSSGDPGDWQEHVDGKSQYVPPVPPLLPARFTGALYLNGRDANCLNFAQSEQYDYADYVQTVLPNTASYPVSQGYTPGMLGYMFWAAGRPSARRNYTPTTDCTGGMGTAARVFDIPLPMPALRPR